MSFSKGQQLNLAANGNTSGKHSNGGEGGFDTKGLIDVTQLIDLTDKPIGLTRDEIGWSKVRANASNCICCCCNNSITLVTTDASYILDHVPLNDIQFAQANASLQQLALSNHRKLVIIDLVDSNIDDDPAKQRSSSISNGNGSSSNHSVAKETKVVNLAAHGVTMSDIIYWRWLDNNELAILTYDALYTCPINQQNISHPAFTALTNRSRYLSMERICDVHQHIGSFCQVTDIHRDSSKNLYAITGLYSTKSLLSNLTSSTLNSLQQSGSPLPNSGHHNLHHALSVPTALRPSFGSVPSKLSQLTNNNKSFDSLNSDHLFDLHGSQDDSSNNEEQGEIYGLAQVYCKLRDRSQLVRAHALTFTSSVPQKPREDLAHSDESTCDNETHLKDSTILVATSKIDDKIRVHFTEMFTGDGLQTGQNTSQTTKLDRLNHIDFPSSIVCSHLETPNEALLHVAMITTKYGQLFVCSVTHGVILFSTNLTTDIISSSILESRTRGLMVVCRNGQVLLAKLNLTMIKKLLDEKKILRNIPSSHSFIGSMDLANNNLVNSASDHGQTPDIDREERSSSPDIGPDIIISTKL